MSTLADLRNLVRSQTETLLAELSDVTINDYLQQAFDRTIAAESQWPSYEMTWEPVQPAGKYTMPLPGDCNPPAIMSLMPLADSQHRLTMADNEICEDFYLSTLVTAGSPVNFSIWANEIVLWPHCTYDQDMTYRLRGHRLPNDWIARGADSVPDCDRRLHGCLVHYAIALAYAQQEDAELEAQYMDRWAKDAEAARQAIMIPAQQRPLIMGPVGGSNSTTVSNFGAQGRTGGWPLVGSVVLP